MAADFDAFIQTELEQHRGERIHRFEYLGEIYWLKQPEKLRGVWLLLKPKPQQAFQEEVAILKHLNAIHAPVPKLCAAGEDFMVLADAGHTLNYWLHDENLPHAEKMQLLRHACDALIGLHQKKLIHGRPAIRDMAWHQGQILFMDFESHSKSQHFEWLVSRDILAFLDSLCREKTLSKEDLAEIFAYYHRHCEPQYWDAMQRYVARFRWLYYLLLPFKPVARTDLLAIYRLFELLKKEKK